MPIKRRTPSKVQAAFDRFKFDVTNFGADPSGQKDSTKAFQKAFDRVQAAGGGNVYVPRGDYELSSQGSWANAWSGTTVHYAVKVTNAVGISLEFGHGATCHMNMAGGTKANMFLFDGCTDITITGAQAEGYGPVTHYKYDGALISIFNCKDVTVRAPKSLNMFHTVVAFRSQGIKVYEAFGRRQGAWANATTTADGFSVTPPEHGTFIGMYASADCIIQDCNVYGGCQDGDIGVFGGGKRNSVERCGVYNFFYDDQSYRRTTFNNGQGIYVDSGPRHTSVRNCFVFGYFYGIDVKTDIENTVVEGNFVFNSLIGIAVRRGQGEGDIMLEGVVVRNNTINPNGGNGKPGFTWIGGATVPGCIFVQDVAGVTIEGNTFANSITATNLYPFATMFTKSFIGVGVQYTSDWATRTAPSWVPITIRNNDFWLEQRMSENEQYGASTREGIVVLGSSTIIIPTVDIINNTFDPRYTVPASITTAEYPNGLIRASYVQGLRIRGNQFGDTYTSSASIMIDNCNDVDVEGNHWGVNCGLASFTTCNGVNFNHNTSYECVATLGNRVYIGMTAVTQASVCRNKMYRKDPAPALDTFYISASGGITNLMATHNDLNLGVKDSTNWTNGPGGTLITGGIIEKNIIRGTVV